MPEISRALAGAKRKTATCGFLSDGASGVFSEEKPREMCHVATRENSGRGGKRADWKRCGGNARRNRGGCEAAKVGVWKKDRDWETERRMRRTNRRREGERRKMEEGRSFAAPQCVLHPAWPLFPYLSFSLGSSFSPFLVCGADVLLMYSPAYLPRVSELRCDGGRSLNVTLTLSRNTLYCHEYFFIVLIIYLSVYNKYWYEAVFLK